MNQPGNMAHGFSVVGSVMCDRIDWHIQGVYKTISKDPNSQVYLVALNPQTSFKRKEILSY